MSHFTVAVILPNRVSIYTNSSVERAVGKLMRPYAENGVWFGEGSRWDWWVIGGRWDGVILGLEWEPKLEICNICDGAGVRPGGLKQFGQEWFDNCNGCNGCQGTGKSEAWPTDDRYSTLDRNMCPMPKVSWDYTPTAFVRPTGEWIEQERVGFWGMGIADEQGLTREDKVAGFDQAWVEARESYSDHLVVAVDAHV